MDRNDASMMAWDKTEQQDLYQPGTDSWAHLADRVFPDQTGRRNIEAREGWSPGCFMLTFWVLSYIFYSLRYVVHIYALRDG